MDNNFGDHIKQLHTCYNLTQRDLARLAGSRYSTVKQYDYTTCKPRLSEDTFNG